MSVYQKSPRGCTRGLASCELFHMEHFVSIALCTKPEQLLCACFSLEILDIFSKSCYNDIKIRGAENPNNNRRKGTNMKYRLIIGDGHTRVEGNNKAHLIQWANSVGARAMVEVIATGEIIHENATLRRINKNLTTLRNLADAHRAGKKIIK